LRSVCATALTSPSLKTSRGMILRWNSVPLGSAMLSQMPNLQGFSSYICYIFFYLLNSAAVDTEGNRIWRSGAIWCRCTRHHVFIRLCQLITADGARAVFVKDPVRRIGLGVGSVFQMGLSINGWVQKKLSGWFISWKIMENPSING